MRLGSGSAKACVGALALGLGVVCAGSCGAAGPGGDEGASPARVRLDRSILADPTRPADEREQDAARRALDVYEWLGIEPGMTVADVFAGRGYNTHLLSRVVGDEGLVYAVFEFYADESVFDGRIYFLDDVEARVAEAGLDNVVLLEAIEELPERAVDVVLLVRNYHDVEWVFADLRRHEVVAALHRALVPGGIAGVVEVATDADGWDESTHRLAERVVVADFTAGGFVLEGRSDMLANPDDDHSTSGFEKGRHTMDRYLLKFRKPLDAG